MSTHCWQQARSFVVRMGCARATDMQSKHAELHETSLCKHCRVQGLGLFRLWVRPALPGVRATAALNVQSGLLPFPFRQEHNADPFL